MAAGVCIGLLLVLREAAAEIRRARARSDFVIGVSHDLRTPVASMRMLAESLYLDHVESRDQQKKFLEKIKRSDKKPDRPVPLPKNRTPADGTAGIN